MAESAVISKELKRIFKRVNEITERNLKRPKVTCFCAFNARWGTLGPLCIYIYIYIHTDIHKYIQMRNQMKT